MKSELPVAVVMVVVVIGNMAVEADSMWNLQPWRRQHVKIVNQLGDNRPLTVHCKSGDDDLGFHILAAGKEYEFGFQINMMGTTLFWCNFWDDRKHHAVFDVFDAKATFTVEQCGNNWCTWEPRDDGFYLFDSDSKKFIKKHLWFKI
ncbi:S-protein homolog 6-like [Carica papaya]|uniref:S-protein homolog 6-like n=1 Tax=Carica papaya TaxID=3649 RepID=UPI000B8C8A6F|nr:S-protein homolog 6-like [Carica papaya]